MQGFAFTFAGSMLTTSFHLLQSSCYSMVMQNTYVTMMIMCPHLQTCQLRY